MKLLKTLAFALGLGLVAVPSIAPAQQTDVARRASDVAPVNNAATPSKPGATLEQPTIAMASPDPKIGQPVPASIELQPQVTPNGRQALWMHNIVLMPIITAICLFVLALLFWASFRYRRSANTVPSKTSHNTVIEVIWTLVPVLILVAIAIPSISLLAAQYKPPSRDAVTLKAVGNQWYWTYEYPDHGGFEIVSNMLPEAEAKARGEPRLLAVDNRVVLPVGQEIRLLTTSNDVIHSWAIPAFWAKMDAVPGRINEMSFTIDRPGVYYGQCSELCGARHAFMPIAVQAVSKADFARWIASKGGTMPGAAAAAPPADPVATDAGPAVAPPAPITPTPVTPAPVQTNAGGSNER